MVDIALHPFDLERSMKLQHLGHFDPTGRASPGRMEKWFSTENGVAKISLAASNGVVSIEGSGAGGRELVDAWASHFPPDDGHEGFAPGDALLARLHRASPGLRLLRVPWLFDVSCGAILQQRVTFADAAHGWRKIVGSIGVESEHGSAFPPAKILAKTPSWKLESLGIDPKRARTLIALAHEEVFRPFLHGQTSRADLRARLGSIRGIGPWTTETILGFGAGDPDAVPTGDLHLPHLVTWALAREPRGSDARMLELLEPHRGHRFRVARLLYGARITIPRTSTPRPR